MGRILLILFNFLFFGLAGQTKSRVIIKNNNGSEVIINIESNLSALLTEMNAASFENRSLNFSSLKITSSCQERLRKIWSMGKLRSQNAELTEYLLKLPDGRYQIRGVPLIVKIDEQSKGNIEGVFSITSDGRIDDLFFGIEQHQYKSILDQGEGLEDFKRRQYILDFLENYRTAYNRKDLTLIEQTFSENALIIVGKVLENKPIDGPSMLNSLEPNRVELIRFNKQQYISNLQKVFRLNKFIDVQFQQIEIVKHPIYKDLYGVHLLQTWRSSTYSDSGYLFLIIDFEDQSHPLIHVRAWQPEAFTTTSEIISLGDFDIIK